MRWARHAERMGEERNWYGILFKRIKGKRPFDT
jgi:hypothetical protein